MSYVLDLPKCSIIKGGHFKLYFRVNEKETKNYF